MDTLLDVLQDAIYVDSPAGLSYEESLSYDTICESVQNASDFFSLSDPMLTIESYTTGVYNNIPFTEVDDVLIFNRQQLSDMGISERDGLDLVMTHECAHRALQGLDLGFDAHQEELCCDYMAGVRAGLNDIDISQMVNSLRDTMECESHPAGLERVDAIEAGVQFAQNFMDFHHHAPTFDDCLDDFRMNDCLYDSGNQTLWDNDNVSFRGALPPEYNRDGYIPDGKITLERTVSGDTDTFKVYSRDGGQYVHEGGKWIRVDGNGTVNIKGVKYDKS